MVVQAKQDIYGRGHHVSYRPWPTIVAIGASAGGIKALQTFFDRLPERVGAAIVVVIHLDPEHESELSQILAAHTRMPVIQVREAVTLENIPPDRRLQVTSIKSQPLIRRAAACGRPSTCSSDQLRCSMEMALRPS
jgi:chemotaxis response regulator CheB